MSEVTLALEDLLDLVDNKVWLDQMVLKAPDSQVRLDQQEPRVIRDCLDQQVSQVLPELKVQRVIPALQVQWVQWDLRDQLVRQVQLVYRVNKDHRVISGHKGCLEVQVQKVRQGIQGHQVESARQVRTVQ